MSIKAGQKSKTESTGKADKRQSVTPGSKTKNPSVKKQEHKK
ncbi:hypothetical protein [Pseudidiomarina sp.]